MMQNWSGHLVVECIFVTMHEIAEEDIEMFEILLEWCMIIRAGESVSFSSVYLGRRITTHVLSNSASGIV